MKKQKQRLNFVVRKDININEEKINNTNNKNKKVNRPITSITNIQSPKIKTNFYRSNSQPKLFSLNDIKNKYRSKGLSIPNQFKREFYMNIDQFYQKKNPKYFIELIEQKNKIEKEKKKNEKKEEEKKINTNAINNKEEEEIKIDIKENKSENNLNKDKKIRKYRSMENILENNDHKKEIKNNLSIKGPFVHVHVISRKEKIFKPHFWDNVNPSKIKNQRDKLMPEGYELFEKEVKNTKNNYIKNNYIIIPSKNNSNDTNTEYPKININSVSKTENTNREKSNSNNEKTDYNNIINSYKNKNKTTRILIRIKNKIKQYESDIFFQKNSKKNENTNNNNNCNEQILSSPNQKEKKYQKMYKYPSQKYFESDIFNLKSPTDFSVIEKSGEKNYFRKIKNDSMSNSKSQNRNNNNIYYNSNSESTGWLLKDNSQMSLLNYTSSEYHPLNRDMKNTGKTKEQIENECHHISPYLEPSHKKKSLCEFIDLSRVSAPNINKDYMKAITNNPNVFKRRNEIGTEFYNIFGHYSNICDKPFQKFNPIS